MGDEMKKTTRPTSVDEPRRNKREHLSRRYLPSLLFGGITSRPMVLRKPTFGSKSGVWSITSGCSCGIGNTDSTNCSISKGTSGGSGFNLYLFSTLQSSISIVRRKRKRFTSVNTYIGRSGRKTNNKKPYYSYLPFLILKVVRPNMARNASFFSEYCNLAGGPLIIQRSTSFVSSSPSESELHARPDTEGKWREGIEMMGAKGIVRDGGGGGGGGPITAGVKDEIEGIGGIDGAPPIDEELIAGGGPRFRGDRVEVKGGGIAAVLTEQIVAEPKDDGGPMGAVGFGNVDKREW
ncbi:hypothetical protein WN51_00993 [Melipona quadrifasciata]|uniref:Uncharacterized protein n=1 Tax=Melipona quadrifasciata TaxID=166423 RepID=A0A0N0U4P7_9HYME|nr:hypothetical protein WN51_00993 [Melipona quadrifasciata]